MLEEVKWGEFRIGDLFEVTTSKGYDAGKLSFVNQSIETFEFVGRTKSNYGIQGFVERLDTEPNNKDTISVSQIGAVHAQLRKRKWYSSQNVFVLTPKTNQLINLLTVASINKILSNYGGYSSYPTLKTLREHRIELPILEDGEINFSFMEKFIAELEATHLAELDAYLSVTGLKDYELTKEERRALEVFENKEIKWKDFRIGNLFTRIKTNKLPYKAKELPQEETGEYNLPCLTSSFQNQGLNYFAPREGATILKNVISIPSNSDVYRAYYQSRDFTVLSDAYAIKFQKLKEITSKKYLFLVTSINKKTNLPIYSYKNKLGGWNVVKDKFIKLPIKEQEEIDYDFMETFISAIKKLVIKDVVKFSNKKLETTKEIINK